jgi:hypothetical protein
MPFSRRLRAFAASASATLRVRPPLRPLAAAAASPARVHSIIVSRSSWAKAGMIVSIALPIGPSVCSPSVRLRNPNPPGGQLVHHREDVLGVASESIELPHRQDVTFTEVVEARRELRAVPCRAAHAVVGEGAGCPCIAERVELELGGLIGRADPCVPDSGHPVLLSHNPVAIAVLIPPGYETGFQDNRWSS